MISKFTLASFIFGFVVWQSAFGKDRVLQVLESAQNWLEQPSVGKDGSIDMDLYGKGLSYTMKGACTYNLDDFNAFLIETLSQLRHRAWSC